MLFQSEKHAHHCTGILCIDDSLFLIVSINVDTEKAGDIVQLVHWQYRAFGGLRKSIYRDRTLEDLGKPL